MPLKQLMTSREFIKHLFLLPSVIHESLCESKHIALSKTFYEATTQEATN